jgi:hypothetical protein
MTGDDVEAFPEGEATVKLEARVHLHEVVVRPNLPTTIAQILMIGGYTATWKRECKLPLCKADLLKTFR